MGVLNVWHRFEFSGGGKGIKDGDFSKPLTITCASNLAQHRRYSLADNATSKIYDESLEISDPACVIIMWSDGPVELSWGEDTAAANADTSSFVSNDAVGGFMYLWGSGQYEHVGDKVSQRNTDSATSTDVGIQTVWCSNQSGGTITVDVYAFK